MRKNIFLFLFVLVIAASCSKKTGDMMTKTEDNVKSTVDKAIAWRSTPPAPAPARAISLGEYNSFDLDNGLKVIVVENHKLPRVSYQISLQNEALIEGEKAGYVSLAGDLLSKGTENRTKAEIDQAVDFIGANMSTFGSGMFGSSLKKHSASLLDIMTDVLYNPTFPEEEFKKIKSQTLSGLQSAKADANAIAGNVRNKVLYGDNHPYGENQTEKTTEAIDIETCKKYVEKHFIPNNAYLVIVGDITPDEAKMQAEKYFGKWEKGPAVKYEYEDPEMAKGTNVIFANKEGAVQSVINIAYPVELAPASDEALKASVMNNILGGGIFSGRLMQNLREDKAYTYGARSSISPDRLIGNFVASASVRNEVTDSSVTEFLYEMERLTKEPVSMDDLQLTKNSMAGSFARSLESPQTIARFATNTFRYNLSKDYYNTYLQRLENVSVADVQNIASKYIRPDNCNIIVVGNKDEVADKLVKFDTNGKIDFYDAYGMKLKEIANEVPAGITADAVISDYISAIGGKETLMNVKTIVSTMGMDLMGQKATVVEKKKAPGMYMTDIQAMGMTMQKITMNADGVTMAGPQGAQSFSPGDKEYESMKGQAEMFPQLNYGEGYTLELKGKEDVEGQVAYKILVTNPDGDKSTEYYSATNNLLIRSITSQEANGQTQTVTADYTEYKEVNGVFLPHTVTITGAAPFPMKMVAESIEINTPVPNTEFMSK